MVSRKLKGKEGEIISLYLAGQSLSEIGSLFGVHSTTVLKQLRKHDIPRRTVVGALAIRKSMSKRRKPPPPFSEAHRRNISLATKGYVKTHEHRRNLSTSMKQRGISDEYRTRMTEGLRRTPRKPFSEKAKQAIAKAKRGKHAGESSWNWRGGISFLPYPSAFNRSLKRCVRERDNFTCRGCGAGRSHIVHHINYDKSNCSGSNLITLCKSCHGKTQFNRDFWTGFFSGLIIGLAAEPEPLKMEEQDATHNT